MTAPPRDVIYKNVFYRLIPVFVSRKEIHYFCVVFHPTASLNSVSSQKLSKTNMFEATVFEGDCSLFTYDKDARERGYSVLKWFQYTDINAERLIDELTYGMTKAIGELGCGEFRYRHSENYRDPIAAPEKYIRPLLFTFSMRDGVWLNE
jgi:hypothetical protein